MVFAHRSSHVVDTLLQPSRAAGLAVAGLLTWLVLGVSVAVAQPRAGAEAELSLGTPTGPVALTFCYCPAGTLRPGLPKKEPAAPVSVRGFYLQEA